MTRITSWFAFILAVRLTGATLERAAQSDLVRIIALVNDRLKVARAPTDRFGDEDVSKMLGIVVF
jgi:hypothetical protein